MSFREKLKHFWRKFTLRHGHVDHYSGGSLRGNRRASRFIFDNSGYAASTKRANLRQFLPQWSAKKKQHELSVTRTEALDESSIWNLGDKASGKRKKPALARADLRASQIRWNWIIAFLIFKQRNLHSRWQWKLRVQIDEPPDRHLLIVGWPPNSEPDAQRILACVLSESATLYIR